MKKFHLYLFLFSFFLILSSCSGENKANNTPVQVKPTDVAVTKVVLQDITDY